MDEDLVLALKPRLKTRFVVGSNAQTIVGVSSDYKLGQTFVMTEFI